LQRSARTVGTLGVSARAGRRSTHGLCSGLHAEVEELTAIAEALGLLGRLRAFYVDDERPLAYESENELLRLISRIHVSVNQPDGNVEEAAFLDLRVQAAARTELESRASFDEVAEHLAVAVVVPAGSDTPLSASADEKYAVGREGDLAKNARRRVTLG
jgi:hypothetical protein